MIAEWGCCFAEEPKSLQSGRCLDEEIDNSISKIALSGRRNYDEL